MDKNNQTKEQRRPVGYEALIERHSLQVLPNCHRSYVATRGTHRIDSTGGVIEEIYPAKYWPGESLGDHLEFALKYDGTNLGILDALFRTTPREEFLDYVRSKPTGKYARRLWFLYEFLTGKHLPLDDLKQGNYIDLLDPDRYYTLTDSIPQIRRQRINDNLLGTARFCPMIRRTETLRGFENTDVHERCRKLLSSYPPELLRRALSYLYIKETRSSFEIEHVTPDATRTERFIAMLKLAEHEDFCEKSRLIELQNRTVDSRFAAAGYRDFQNYVGEAVTYNRETVHLAGPRPEDLADLMEGLVEAHRRMEECAVSATVHAAAISYGFVFLHPFEDGNGRIHRFLIHNILARRGLTPGGLIFPISATMLKEPSAYDASLEAYSRPLMSLVEYSLDELGRMTVHNETAFLYKYIDMTPQAEALSTFIENTIKTELVEELVFLANYDETKKAIQAIVDMPDRLIDLFIRFCLQHAGPLSGRKRTSHFDFLSTDEIERMEEAVRLNYGTESTAGK